MTFRNRHLRIVCEYILDKEKEDFIEHVKDARGLDPEEVRLILNFVASGVVRPPLEILLLLKKINHIYAHAVLAYNF